MAIHVMDRPWDAALARLAAKLAERARRAVSRPGLDVVVSWRDGFVDELSLTGRALHVIDRDYQGWLDQPALRFVRSIHVSANRPRGIRVLGAAPFAAGIQRLTLGSVTVPFDQSVLAAANRAFPNVTDLHVRSAGSAAFVGSVRLPLRSLVVEADSIDELAMRSVSTGSWPLRSLHLLARRGSNEGLARILDGTVFGEARELAFKGFDPTNILYQLARSHRLSTLDRLGLTISEREIERVLDPGEPFHIDREFLRKLLSK